MINNNILEEFFVWEEKNLIDQSQNLLKNEKQDNSVITIETKTDSTPKDWRDITDPKLRKKMRLREYHKNYRKTNKDKLKTQRKQRNYNNKNLLKIQRKEWYKNNKHKFKEKNKTRIEVSCKNCLKIFYVKLSYHNKYKRLFCSRKCYGEFRKFIPVNEQSAYKGVRKVGESKQIYHRRYVKKHPELIAHLKARRYARKKNADGSHTLKEWDDLIIRFDNKCAFCKETKKLTKDHIIPLSKGGSDFITNIQPLCRSCNSKKHNKI